MSLVCLCVCVYLSFCLLPPYLYEGEMQKISRRRVDINVKIKLLSIKGSTRKPSIFWVYNWRGLARDFHNMSCINFISINLIEELIRFGCVRVWVSLFIFLFMMDLNKILLETRRLVFYVDVCVRLCVYKYILIIKIW